MKRIHHDDEAREGFMLDLDEIARQGARKMLAQALEAEVRAYLDATKDQRDERPRPGRSQRARQGTRGPLGSRSGGGQSPEGQRQEDGPERQQTEVQERDPPSLHAPLSEGHGGPAALVSARSLKRRLRAGTGEFFGTEAGLSAATVTRLTQQWQQEREQFMRRDLSARDYVWVDGIHTAVRLGSDGRLCSEARDEGAGAGRGRRSFGLLERS